MPNNQVGTNVVWEANSGYKDNENKLWRAINKNLNLVVPNVY